MKKRMLLNKQEVSTYDDVGGYIKGISPLPSYRYTGTLIGSRKRQRTTVKGLLLLHVNNPPFLKIINERITLLTLLIASMEHIKQIEYEKTNYPIRYAGNYVDSTGKGHITKPYIGYGSASRQRRALQNRVEKELAEDINKEDSTTI